MSSWILVALGGGLISVAGFSVLVGRYRRGAIRARYLVAIAVGYSAFLAYALLSTLKPTVVSSLFTLALLLPASVAIVVLVREYQADARRSNSTD